jgi:hypothetical protein
MPWIVSSRNLGNQNVAGTKNHRIELPPQKLAVVASICGKGLRWAFCDLLGKGNTGTTLFCSKPGAKNEVKVAALQFPCTQFGVNERPCPPKVWAQGRASSRRGGTP